MITLHDADDDNRKIADEAGRIASRASLRSPPSAIDDDYEDDNRRENLTEAVRELREG